MSVALFTNLNFAVAKGVSYTL